MIRMTQSSSADHAKSYFADGLSQADYYIDGTELQGQFGGRLAERLDLDKTVTKEAFFALCENKRPDTGKALTPRTKEERTCGYDLTFICPKSVSILSGLAKDNHIRDAFEQAVAETVMDVERDSMARVRLNGAQEDRQTGELAFAAFTHMTARAVEGFLPDPYLHRHVYVFNSTFDKIENKFKAVQFREIMRNVGFYQSIFHKRLADKLMALGYAVRKENQSFEVIGVPERVLALFSKRANEINRIAKEQGITEAKKKNELTVRTRAAKQKGLSMSELKAGWLQQIAALGTDQAEGEMPVRYAPIKEIPNIQPEQCVQHAKLHCFERASVMDEKRLLAIAYAHSIGDSSVSIEDITNAFRKDDSIIHVEERGRAVCTIKEILAEERRMVDIACSGRGVMAPLYHTPPDIKLKDQPGAAIQHVLTNTNRVSIIQGGAGTGKTTLLLELSDWIERSGIRVTAVAPTANAARDVLRAEGFLDADTVAKLLSDKEMQAKLEGQVLIVDEGGLLGTQQMTRLLEVVTEKNARLIIVGDTRQHSAVARGDALRILSTVAGIRYAEVGEIRRQKNEAYKAAVQDLADGKIKESFDKLDAMGAIKVIDPMAPHAELVRDYMKAIKQKRSALVISPTHQEGEAVTFEIRQKMKQAGLIGKKEIAALRFSPLNMTEAEKSDLHHYKDGHYIKFNQNLRGIKRGSTWVVRHVDGKPHIEDAKGKMIPLPHKEADRFEVYRKEEISLSKGDSIRITRNGFDDDRKRLNNGMMLEVVSVNKKGEIRLRNKESKVTYTLKDDFGHLAHAHCITSPSSQGKSTDAVFIYQPSCTFPATDMKQWYVSISRGKHDVSVYTDDKAALLEHVSDMRNRQSALELVSSKNIHLEHVLQKQRSEYGMPSPTKEREKAPSIDKRFIDLDYEPGI